MFILTWWNNFWNWVFPTRAVRRAAWALNDKRFIADELFTNDCLMRNPDTVGPFDRTVECPVALYLTKKTGIKVSVSWRWATIVNPETGYSDGKTISLPKNVVEFIQEFDHGKWPHLIRQGI